MTDLSFQSYNAIPDSFQTNLSPIFFYISKDKISKQTKGKNISLAKTNKRKKYLISRIKSYANLSFLSFK